jgi:HlyD family secretion protein
MKRLGILILIIAVLGAVIVAAALLGKRGGEAVAVKTLTVKYQAFQTKLPENGVVQRPTVVTVPTLVAGNIGGIYVRPGDRVAAGQLLATVENPTLESTAAGSQADYDSSVANISTARIQEQNAKVTYEAQVETAKSNLDEARRVYDADASLFAAKALPRNQLDADKTKLDQAQVQYDEAERQLRLGAVTGYGENSVQYAQANAQKARIINASNQQQLGFTRVTAPFDGVIQTTATQPNDPLTPLHPGDAVTQGQALFSIAASDAYIVKAEVDEQDVINVHVGQAANITGEDFPGQTLTGHVAAISPVAIKSSDPSSTARQVLTTIRLDRSPAFLRDGMSVDVDILTANVPHTIVVPSQALQHDGKTAFVYVIRAGKAAEVQVHTGATNDVQTVIKSGLAPGQIVIAEKNPLVHDGTAVKAAK